MKAQITKWIKSLVFFAGAAILILSLVSFSRNEFFLYANPPITPPTNLTGIIGVYIAGFLTFLLGSSSYLAVLLLLLLGIKKLDLVESYGIAESKTTKLISFIVSIVSFSLLVSIYGTESAQFDHGGIIGYSLSAVLRKYLGVSGSFIVGATFFIVSIFLLEGSLIMHGLKKLKEAALNWWTALKEKRQKRMATKQIMPKFKKTKVRIAPATAPLQNIKQSLTKKGASLNISGSPEKVSGPQTVPDIAGQDYQEPDFSILEIPPSVDEKKVKQNIQVNARNLEETLSDFGIEARVVNIERGPVITCYELAPAPGIKITRIAALADDIALSLKSSNVRVVAPLPGKGTIGVEVPNIIKNVVYFREVVDNKNFISSKSKLTLAIGKDAGGNPLIADLKDMPHLLIAGTTGSGKTVCVNSLITSILFKSKPWQVKFLLIDPKMVELAHFIDIPHLLAPVVSNAKKAKAILNWATEEMERRYSQLANEGARNIDFYNANKDRPNQMPFIVIVIDELADLMIVARDEVETALLRLAQLSRAVGIHLILATQRPSVDVVTGVIKANFPARISFKVASKVDSRTVLDVVGAEKLLGKGDLLFIRPGLSKPIRAQSSFLPESDINSIVNSVKKQGRPQYNQEILQLQKKPNITIEEDELTDDAVKVILEANQASASLLQRRLRVGYTRAARLLDLIEQRGIIGPFQGSKPRTILIDRQEYLNNYKNRENNV